jgi:hypothetical protein
MFFGITGHVALKINVPVNSSSDTVGQKFDSALRSAWATLRHDHPTIASQVKFDDKDDTWVKEYHHDSGNWMENTLKWIDKGKTGVEWANSDPPAPLLPTIFVVVPPASSADVVSRDIVLRSPHDVIDGIGTLLLLGNFIRLTAQHYESGASPLDVQPLNSESLKQALSPPYRIAAAVPEVATEAVQKRLSAIRTAAAADASNDADEVMTLPFKPGALVPGAHKRVDLKIPEDKTKKLLDACKKQGATVTHAFHAAITIALRDMQEVTENARVVQYVGYILRNERQHCKAPYEGNAHPAGVYHSISSGKLTVKLKVPGSKEGSPGMPERTEEFVRVLHQMRDYYNGVRDDELHYAIVPSLWAIGSAPILDELGNLPRPLSIPLPSATPSASISSMGRIDQLIAPEYGPIQTHDPWVTGEELRNGYGLFLGAHRGSLSLSTAYNDAWHDQADAAAFLERCWEVVATSFGISSGG